MGVTVLSYSRLCGICVFGIIIAESYNMQSTDNSFLNDFKKPARVVYNKLGNCLDIGHLRGIKKSLSDTLNTLDIYTFWPTFEIKPLDVGGKFIPGSGIRRRSN